MAVAGQDLQSPAPPTRLKWPPRPKPPRQASALRLPSSPLPPAGDGYVQGTYQGNVFMMFESGTRVFARCPSFTHGSSRLPQEGALAPSSCTGMAMSPRLLPLATAVMLYCSVAAVRATPAAWKASPLLDQAGGLPDDFRDHFFDVPLVVRVERDGQYLGDARAPADPRRTCVAVGFTDCHDSTEPAAERERWLKALAAPRPLGACEQACTDGLVRLHYSLESSLLSIATERWARRHAAAPPRAA